MKNSYATVVVDHEGIVCFVNPAAEELFGLDKSTFIGTYLGFSLSSQKYMRIDLSGTDGLPLIAEIKTLEIQWQGNPAHLALFHDVTDGCDFERESLLAVAKMMLE